MEISSGNQAQLAQFQRVQNQESSALNSGEKVQATAANTGQNTAQSASQNSSVNISQEARDRLSAEQQSGSTEVSDTVELQSSGSQAEKPR